MKDKGGQQRTIDFEDVDGDEDAFGLPRKKQYISKSVHKGLSGETGRFKYLKKSKDLMPMYKYKQRSEQGGIDYINPRHHHYNHAPLQLADNLVLPEIYHTYKYKAPLIGANPLYSHQSDQH